MKALPMVGGVLVWFLCSPLAATASPKQPPMNNFNFAFYTCADGSAFQVTYDSTTPTKATLTTNNNNRQYVLTRTSSAAGLQFAKGPVSFQPNGRTALIQGTKTPLKGCKLKSG